MRVYLDHNATTPVDERVLDAMLPFLRGEFGNPSSLHWFGQRARAAVEEARERVARLVGAAPAEIVFTASGSESDNMALRGVAAKATTPRRRLVVSAIEHHAVLNCAKALQGEGWPIAIVGVSEAGRVELADLAAELDDTVALVSLMLANNETGVVQPVAEAARLARARGALVHCDAVQAAGKLALDVRTLEVDLLTLSAHKLYGPKGVGCLFVRRGTPMAPLVRGGGQERNRRAGTENVAGIVGFGAAATLALDSLAAEASRIAALRDRLEERLLGRRARAPQRRRASAAQHDEPLVRSHRGRVPADGPRSGGCRGLDGRRLRGGRRRALPRPARDGPPARARPVVAPTLAGALDDRRADRSRRRRDHGGCGTATPIV